MCGIQKCKSRLLAVWGEEEEAGHGMAGLSRGRQGVRVHSQAHTARQGKSDMAQDHNTLLQPLLFQKLQERGGSGGGGGGGVGGAHRLKTMRMVAAALVGTKDSQNTPTSTVGRALCSRCARGQLSISTYRLGLPVS